MMLDLTQKIMLIFIYVYMPSGWRSRLHKGAKEKSSPRSYPPSHQVCPRLINPDLIHKPLAGGSARVLT